MVWWRERNSRRSGSTRARSRIASRSGAPPPSPRGVRRGPPPTVTARHGDGRGPSLRPRRRAQPPLRRRTLADVPRWPSPTQVTAPSERDRPGIHVHRSPSAETTTHFGIRVTTPLRTLVDLADVLNPKQLTRALNEAQVQRLTTPAELATLLTRPERNQTIAGHEVDAVYRAQRLVIELDSRQFHTTPRAFEHDRDRDADLLNAGFSTLRITDQRLKHHDTKEARRLKDILRSR